MCYAKWMSYLDPLHPRRSRDPIEQRDVFGVQLPAYVTFHAIFGYVILAIGFVAIVLRIPLKFIKRYRWIHPYVGFTWIFGSIWMAVTALWCVHKFLGWDIIAFFIFSMYAAIQLGWVFVSVYKRYRPAAVTDVNGTEAAGAKIPVKVRVWKWLHATAMVYSFIMLLGAGISFPFRATEDYVKSVNGN